MKSRKVLTIDHCFQILLNRVNGLSWQDAIIQAIPARKGAQLRGSDNEDDDNEGEEPDREDSAVECGEGVELEEREGAIKGENGDPDVNQSEVPVGTNLPNIDEDPVMQSDSRVPDEEASSQVDG